MKLAINDFKQIRDYIHEKTGIFLREEKMYFLESRMGSRCRDLNIDNPQDYYRLLKYDSRGTEMTALTELLTTNETFFFRDIKQLYAFSQEALPEILERKRVAGDNTLRIWSAGCSTGEEPYTLAMLAADMTKNMDVKIIASDINSKVVEFAKHGIYTGKSLKEVPESCLTKYFTKLDNSYAVNQEIKSKVEFLVLNLVDKMRMRLLYNVDFIFCRNVLIYFSPSSAKQVINSFYDTLNKGGYIFLGLAESMHLFSGAFKLVKFKELFGYMKE